MRDWFCGKNCMWIWPLAIVISSGCGHQPNLPPMAPVSGIVTLDGEPLPKGTVQFVPDTSKGTSGPTSVGEIGPDGRYAMFTQGVEGAMVGHHRVRVEAAEDPADETVTMPPSLIPLFYNNPATSGLTCEIKADQDNELPIQLVTPKGR